jgi:prolyl oligopeptidase
MRIHGAAAVLLLLASPSLQAQSPDDPYRWLEEVTGDSALRWVRAHNERSTAELAAVPQFEATQARILSILDSDAKIPYIEKIGAYYYNLWTDAGHVQGLWRRTTLEEYRKDTPSWETVLDLDSLSAAEGKTWVWHGADCLPPAYRRCLVALSPGGSDAAEQREFDLATKQFIRDGFFLSEAKSSVAWRDANSVFVGTDFGPGSMTTSGYPRIVREWRRGTPLDSATTVFEGSAGDVSVSGYRDLTPGFERDFVFRGPTFWTSELYLRRNGRLIRIEKPDDANVWVQREWLVLGLRSDWTVGGVAFPAGSVLAINFEQFLTGDRRFHSLFTPGERTAFAGVTFTRHYVLLNELDNVRNRIYQLAWSKGAWTRVPLSGLPESGTVRVTAIDPVHSDDYFLTIADYLTPTTLLHGTVGRGVPTPLKQLPAYFNAAGLEITQHETISEDGTRVPYFQVARKDLVANGRNPTLLYGYGGFEIPMLPGYSATVGSAWRSGAGYTSWPTFAAAGSSGPSGTRRPSRPTGTGRSRTSSPWQRT